MMDARQHSCGLRVPGFWLCATALFSLGSCAELELGAEAVKRVNERIGATALAQATAEPVRTRPGTSPYLDPAPDLFEAAGEAVWDGRQTLQGIWVAHPLAKTARRVRITNPGTGLAVDGALFRRDRSLEGPAVLISSEAAEALGLNPGVTADLQIVALRPARVDPDPAEQAAASQAGADTGAETAAQAAAPRITPAPLTTAPLAAPSETPVAAIASPDPAATSAPATTTGTAAADPASPALAVSEAAGPETVRPPTAKPAIPEPVTAEPATALPAPTAPAAEPPAPLPETAQVARTPEPTPPQVARTPEPTPPEVARAPEPEQAEPVRVPAPQPKAPSTLRQPYLQAGTFSVADNATALVRKLKARGFQARAQAIRSETGTVSRVVVGPLASSAERATALAALRKLGIRDALPVKR